MNIKKTRRSFIRHFPTPQGPRLGPQATSSLNQLFEPKGRHGNDLQPMIVGHIRTFQVSKMGRKAHFRKFLVQKLYTALDWPSKTCIS